MSKRTRQASMMEWRLTILNKVPLLMHDWVPNTSLLWGVHFHDTRSTDSRFGNGRSIHVMNRLTRGNTTFIASKRYKISLYNSNRI